MDMKCKTREGPKMTENSSNIDIHICGACKTQFHDVELFLIHKRQSCPVVTKTPTKQLHTDSRSQLQPSSQAQIQAPPQPHIQSQSQLQIQSSSHLQIQAPSQSQIQVLPQQQIQTQTPPQQQIQTQAPPQQQIQPPHLQIQAPPQSQIQAPPQPQIHASTQQQIQSQPAGLEPVPAEHVPHSHRIQNEAGTEVPYMVTPITPPLGHEYVQTAPKTQASKSQFMNHVLLTDKGEIIIVQDKSGLPYTDQNFYQQHGENLISIIQQRLVQNAQSQVQPQTPTQVQVQTQTATDGRPTEQVLFTNVTDSATEQTQVFQQEIGQDNSAPRMQLDHNGSYSLVPSSQIPANLQLRVNSQQSQLPVSHVISAETGADGQQSANQHLVLKQLLNSGQNQVIIQQIQQQQHQQQLQLHQQQRQIQQQQIQQIQQPQQQFIASNQLTDLAQQAAALSGVEPGFQNPSTGEITTSSEQQVLDNQQYSVHIRTMDQPGTDGSVIENVMQVQEPYVQQIQDNTVSGTQQLDVTDVQDFEDDAMSSPQPSLENARQMFLSSIESSQKSKLSNSGDTPRKAKRVRAKKHKCTYNDTCTYVSSFQKDLERHMRTHTGEKPFICEYCNKGFSRVDKLRLHVRAHVGDRPFKCHLCDYSSVDSSGLKKHSVTHTRDRKHKCQVCPYACRTAGQLTVHLRVHTGDCPFPCPFCQSKFKIKSDLRRHIRVHTGEKPYICGQCGVKCTTNGNLASHVRVHHSHDKQIKCPQCVFSSSSKRILREHLKSHEPENPDTTCPICDYQCANKEVLKNHLVTHKTEKEFICSYCNFSTKHKANLVTHIRRKHINILSKKTKDKKGDDKSPKTARIKIGNTYSSKRFEKQFQCDLCDESFVRKDSLNSHKRLHMEMAKSTLSTALTVLRLQQPVINVTTSQTVPTSSEAASCSGQQELNKNGTQTLSSDINEISIIEKQGTSNTNIENDDVTVPAQITEQVDLTSVTTSVQPVINNEMVLSQNLKQRISQSSNSLQIQLEPNSIQQNNVESLTTTGISESQHFEPQEISSTSISATQADITNRSYEEHEDATGHPGTNVVINIEGEGQSTGVSDISHQNTEMTGNAQNLNNHTLSAQQNSVTMTSPMCQIPGIQLVQNISFPLVRLPNGQIITAFNGQPIAGPQLVSNPAQGTSPGDIQVQPVQQNIPVRIIPCGDQQNFYTGTRTTEPFGQFIDSSGQQIQSPIQLVLATSATNNTTGNLSESACTQNSVQEVTSSTEVCTTVDNQQSSEQTNVITLPIRMNMTNQSNQETNVVLEN